MKKKVVIGLSGGVDSAVSALLLKQQGYDVHALFMINWKNSSVTLSGDCAWEEDQLVAQMVAKQIGIPLHVVDSSERYMTHVVDYMFNEYSRGRTPNPDVLCNREIKFEIFNRYAQELGADYVATGHYCRREETTGSDGNTYSRLLAGSDPNKDQSYFLCQMSQEQLKNVLFPIGDIIKPEVRRIAAEANLACAKRKDSQGICFVGKVDLPVFLQQKLKSKEGDIVEITDDAFVYRNRHDNPDDLEALARPYIYTPDDGFIIAKHIGAQYYTIGQRKGLNIGGHEKPVYVLATDIERNIIYIGMGDDHPGLFRKALFIHNDEIHNVRPDLALKNGESLRCKVRIRYRQPLQDAEVIKKEQGIFIKFDIPQKSITPGQFAAWYINDELIGSGVIAF
ncbi:MAG: tRNA 2-thiouridine(34) synthase MnmA [Bacteroidales bacterium]|nr:tRNA 2-thiouridine(34) synthase MnmA [Bacteroidales bacterium]MBP5369423.1 tRNA 2-thiouridine(34) synthase MnmA [Bacteroidales bacterium]